MTDNRSTPYFFDVLIVSAALILTEFTGALAHLSFLPWFKPLPSFITVLAVVFVCTAYSKRYYGELRFGKVFGYGMKVAALASVVVAIYTYLSLTKFFPELKALAIEQAKEVLSQRDDMTQGTLDTAIAMTERMFIPLAVFGSMISVMVLALIGGVISYFFSRPFLKGSAEGADQ